MAPILYSLFVEGNLVAEFGRRDEAYKALDQTRGQEGVDPNDVEIVEYEEADFIDDRRPLRPTWPKGVDHAGGVSTPFARTGVGTTYSPAAPA